jgi:uncharacterized membrane protein YdbT with pleckstrin-like domain
MEEPQKGEQKIIFQTSLHPIVLLSSILETIFFLGLFLARNVLAAFLGNLIGTGLARLFKDIPFFVVTSVQTAHWMFSVAVVIRLLLLLLFIFSLLKLSMELDAFLSTRFMLTDFTVVSSHGMVARNREEMPLDALELIQVVQSMGQRLFSIGTLILVGTGGTAMILHNLRQPFEFQKQIQLQKQHGKE